jgi:hypothetical protein
MSSFVVKSVQRSGRRGAAVTVRGVALPIGLGLVWVMAVENLITNVVADLVSWLRPVRDLMPAANSGALIRAVTAKVDLGNPAPGVNSLVSRAHVVRARDLQWPPPSGRTLNRRCSGRQTRCLP